MYFRNSIILLTISLIFYTSIIFSQNSSKALAILPIKCSGFHDSSINEAITEITQNAFIDYSDYLMIERNQINNILAEQELQLSGLTESAVEVGKLLSIKEVVVGSLIKLGNEITFSIRIVNTETGEILKSEKSSANIPIEYIDEKLIAPTVEKLLTINNSNDVEILIKQVVGLDSKDFLSRTDCWIKILLNNELIGRTRVIHDNNSPQFEERFLINGYKQGDLITLKFYDYDDSSEHLFGKVEIDTIVSGLYPIETTYDVLVISRTNKKSKPIAKEKGHFVGQVELTFEQ